MIGCHIKKTTQIDWWTAVQNGNDSVNYAELFKTEMCTDLTNQSLLDAFINEMLICSDSEKANRLWGFLNGLTNSGISYKMVALILNSLLSLDGYRRNDLPFVDIKKPVVEYTGSGKKSFKTLNISTPSAITAVSCGACIIKKGSHSTSSMIGSANLLEALGFRESSVSAEQMSLLKDTGFTFLNIERIIPRFNSIYSGYYYSPHILSYMLGAVVTSLRTSKILYGLSLPEVEFSAKAINEYTADEALVFSSTEDKKGYIDEIAGRGYCSFGRSNVDGVKYLDLSAGFPLSSIKVPENKFDSIRETVAVLNGKGSNAYRYVVSLNAALLLTESGVIDNWADAFELAKNSLLSGTPYKKLKEIIECSGGEISYLEKYKS
jgi:anthranilate phosphoribosyltransferase